jgi:phage terminase Nu1 subunit (DNA packaging protein)
MTDSNIVGAAELADWAACSTRRVRELAEAKIFVKAGRGKYRLKESLQGLIKHQRELAAGRAGLDAKTDIIAANFELKQSQARLAQLRYEREAGNLISYTTLHRVLDPITRAVRDMFLGLPGKIRFSIPTLSVTDLATIEQICRDDLEDAAMGKGYFETVMAQVGTTGGMGDDEV